jgi:tRNA(His) guanylyltransferase
MIIQIWLIMSDNSSLGDRIKIYEDVSRHKLIRRMPVIIRLDGRAFHTLTANLDKPFDIGFMSIMQTVAKVLCEEIPGTQLAYVQSDEISLFLVDYQKLDTQSWFDNNLQKIVSVSSSIATLAFRDAWDAWWSSVRLAIPFKKAHFDSRAFNLPREEVANYFVWRQQDATRNSIQSVGQANFSHKDLHGLSCVKIQDKLFEEKQINWNDFNPSCKRGTCIVKQDWGYLVDTNTPIFTQDRNYIEKYLNPDIINTSIG